MCDSDQDYYDHLVKLGGDKVQKAVNHLKKLNQELEERNKVYEVRNQKTFTQFEGFWKKAMAANTPITLNNLKYHGFTIGMQVGSTTQTHKGNVVLNLDEKRCTYEVYVRHAKEPCKGIDGMLDLLKLDELINGK